VRGFFVSLPLHGNMKALHPGQQRGAGDADLVGRVQAVPVGAVERREMNCRSNSSTLAASSPPSRSPRTAARTSSESIV